MPVVVPTPAQAEKTEQQERLWLAIKRHVLQERKRKKEELEAEVEEERLRKEREARQKENVMTLGETKEQIQLLERKLEDLKKEKSQLFIQYKKVLNKDDNRKRQSEKETPENFPVSSKSSSHNPPVFIPPRVAYQSTTNSPNNHSTHKRKRSPSPTANFHRPAPEEHRRPNESGRAVLWTKPIQYRPTAITTGIPYHPSQSKPQLYPTFHGIRSGYPQPQPPPPPPQTSAQMKHDVQSKQGGQPTNLYHIDCRPINQKQMNINVDKNNERHNYTEIKHDDRPDLRQKSYENMAAMQRRDGMPIYQVQIPPPQNSSQVVKTGSITQGVSYAPRPPPNHPPSHYPSMISRY